MANKKDIMKKIKTALISVFDKTNLELILKQLRRNNVKLISSGGTFKSIKNLGYKCLEISSFTGFNEILDGRVKTLHPKVHAGILNKRNNKKHLKKKKKNNFENIDLVICNFYPFEKTLEKTKNENKIIENIDIGGPTLVRAAAKNFNDVTVITDKNDYSVLEKELEKHGGRTSSKFRKKMASKAFGTTAYYDAVVAEWFNQKLNIKFPKLKTFFGEKMNELRYGENPHQNSSIYLSN